MNQSIDTSELMTLDDMANGHLDVATLGEAANEDKVITSRLGKQYPSAPMASRLLVENGLLGATPFSTYAAMTASTLVDGDYAIVTNDPIIDNLNKNGIYEKVSGAWVYSKYNLQNYITAMQEDIDVINTLSELQQLKVDLSNPLYSVQIRLIGDSITWGVGSSGTSSDAGRNHTLNDPRNNLTNGSWANLLRKWLGKTYFDEAALVAEPLVSGLSSGSGYYAKTFYIDAVDPASGIEFFNDFDGTQIQLSDIIVKQRVDAFFMHHIDLAYYTNANKPLYNYNARVEFEMIGDNFTVVHAGNGTGTNRFVDVYDNNVKIGEFDYSAPTAWSLEKPFTVPYGSHRISLRNRSRDGGLFRFEAIKVNQKIRVANDGISGSWTQEWLPNGGLLQPSKPDDYVFIMLGTNDRSQLVKPLTAQKTKDNLRIIANALIATGKRVILMSANAASTSDEAKDRKYNQGDVSRVTQDLAAELGVDFISNYAATVQAKIDGIAYTSDGLHPNDLGHRIIFDNIRNTIINA